MPPFGSLNVTTTAATATATTTTYATAVSKPNSIAPEDCKVPQAGDDGISSLAWSPTQNYLASTNWDGGVRVWEVQDTGGQVCAIPKAMVRHDASAPGVLDCCFNEDGTTIFSAGCDRAVRMWKGGENPPNNIARQIGFHDAPVKAVRYLSSNNLVVSGGWDRKLKLWDGRSNNPAGSFDLPDRVYGLDVQGNLMVAITANRNILVYDVRGQQPGLSRTDKTTLSSQPRSVACRADQEGFAVGVLEGRVYCEVLRNSTGSSKLKNGYAYKCHRHLVGQKYDTYSVNSIAFHPKYGTCATGGADGVVAFWDLDKRTTLKRFDRIRHPIPCLAFSADGNLLAYASSYDWSKGSSNYAQGSPNEIYIHRTLDSEIKPKSL